MKEEKSYILGTHDEEISRLGLQHAVWRPRALDAWRRAGFTAGQTILDVGCGPGYASFDLADIVGVSGRVIAVDRSQRFLQNVRSVSTQRGLENITSHEVDLDEGVLPVHDVDGAWCRWVFAFVKKPKDLLGRVGSAMKKGGSLVIHEYFDYSTWRFAPRCPEAEEFVDTVMKSWRDNGGEPDIGLNLPAWLAEAGFEMQAVQPIIDIVPPSNFVWQWPIAFVKVNLVRLTELGYLTQGRADAIAEAIERQENTPGTLMITPAVIEIIAKKSG